MNQPAQYTEIDALSQSAIKDAHNEGWRYFYERYIAKTIPSKESAAFDAGSALHTLLLEPNKSDRVVCIPQDVLSASGSKAGAKWKEFEAANEGKLLFKQHDYDCLHRALDAARSHPAARQWLEAKGDCEAQLRWQYSTDAYTVDAKGIVDKYVPGLGICDVKSSSFVGPGEFQRQAEKLYYDVQSTWYMSSGLPGLEYFVFIAVEIQPPFRVRAYEVPDEWFESGRKVIDNVVNEFVRRKKSGNWFEDCDRGYVRLEKMRWR